MKFTPSLLFQSLNKVINYGIKKVLAVFARLLQPSVVNCFKQVIIEHVGIFVNY